MLAFIDKQRETYKHVTRTNVHPEMNRKEKEMKKKDYGTKVHRETKRKEKEMKKRDYGDEPATLMALIRYHATQNHDPAS
jgi:hypothetical protein